MYKSTARAINAIHRTGSYATRGHRTGLVDIVPREPKHEWYPELFEKYYELAGDWIKECELDGFRFRDGARAAAAMAASECQHEIRAKDAMRTMLKGMALNA